jgi:hypothetical protein
MTAARTIALIKNRWMALPKIKEIRIVWHNSCAYSSNSRAAPWPCAMSLESSASQTNQAYSYGDSETCGVYNEGF